MPTSGATKYDGQCVFIREAPVADPDIIWSVNVPDIVLIDLPGVFSVAGPDDPPNIAEYTRQITFRSRRLGRLTRERHSALGAGQTNIRFKQLSAI